MRLALPALLVVLVPLALGGCHLFAVELRCATDTDCPSDQRCDAPLCVADGDGATEGEGEGGEGEGEGEAACVDDGDCASRPACSGFSCRCDAGTCVSSCAGDNADCPATSACVVDTCAPRCNSDTDCSADAYCDAVGLLFGDTVCFVGCRLDADDVDNCASGTLCSGGTRRCVAPSGGSGAQFDLCANSSECGGQRSCFIFNGADRGFCAESCNEDVDCDIGLRCALNRCQEECTTDGACAGGACCTTSGLPECFAGLCSMPSGQ